MSEKFTSKDFATARIVFRQNRNGSTQWFVCLPDGDVEPMPSREACIKILKVYGFDDAK